MLKLFNILLKCVKFKIEMRENKYSNNYYEIIEKYKNLHINGTEKLPGSATFLGYSLVKWVHKIRKIIHSSNSKTLIDYGCGKGAFVSAFSTLRPDWQLVGTDIDEANRLSVEAIANTTYVAAADGTVSGDYDLITLSHVLEHLVPLDERLVLLVGEIRRFSKQAKRAMPHCCRKLCWRY